MLSPPRSWHGSANRTDGPLPQKGLPDMAVKVAINGFGRIGRLVARAILERPDCGLELVAINDLADAKANALLFKRDSVHGPLPGEVSAEGDQMFVNGRALRSEEHTAEIQSLMRNSYAVV